jgi:class 3 adenylate cyclase/tetratricopeptide (TPR) repeat protein
MTCPQCDARNPVTARFCNQCGARLGEPPPELPRATPDSYTPRHLATRILTSRAALEGERKYVTILLADLKGSMELLADRDPEEARQLIDPVLECMMEAVHRYEGTVNQVMGDGIMALFGAPLAHEDHALRACYAALRMQERVSRYGDEVQRTHGVPLQIRVGLNSGDVVVRSIGSDLHMDYTAVGQTTHLAARMEQMAKPGSTLLTPATLKLVEGHVQVQALGAAPIRGLGASMEVFELLGASPGRTRLQVSAARGLTRFIGREGELDQLRAALDRAGSGHGQVMAICGEPGVGKSRLVLELTRSHRTQGWLVLTSSAVSYGVTSALLPVVALLKAYFAIDDHDDARRVREKVTGKVLTLDESLRDHLPVLQALLEIPPPEAAAQPAPPRERVHEAVTALLLRESARQPLLVIVEDLHWIDPDTQALLDCLVERLPSHRVLLLVNYRREYAHRWAPHDFDTELRLEPLPSQTVETLLASLLGTGDDLAPLTALLIERAQGNPFFLEEGVRALVETGVLAGAVGAYRLAGSLHVVQVPATVQAILAARIDRLAPEDKRLLQTASVIGKDVPRVLLRAVADLPDDDLAQGVARLQAADFVYETRLYPDVEYTFTHALTHEVVYGGLVHDRRRALHARVVEAIEALYPDRLADHRDRLVHHAFRGERWGKALAYLRDLGAVASEAEIGEVMGPGPEQPGRLWWAGEHERALKAAERDLAVAASFRNFGMRVSSGCRLGQAHHALGDYARAVEVLRSVAASLEGDLQHERFDMAGFPSVFARSYLAWSLAELGAFPEGEAVSAEAMEIVESAGHQYSQGQIAFGLGIHFVTQGNADQAIPLLERALVGARMANIPFQFPFLMAPLGAAYALAGEVGRAAVLLEQAVDQASSIKLRAHQALRLAWLASARLAQGRVDLAQETARHALDLALETRERGHEAYAHRVLGDVAAARDPAEAAGAYRRALALAETLAMRPLIAQCRLGLGLLHRRAGEAEEARAHLAAAAAMFEAMDMRWWRARVQRESG